MRLAIVCGLSDYKLSETLKPFPQVSSITQTTLIRRRPIQLDNITVKAPPAMIAKFVFLGEIWRIWTVFIMCLFRRCDYLVGIHFKMHCIYAGLFGLMFRIPYMMMIVEDPKKYASSHLFGYFLKRAHSITVRGGISKQYLVDTFGVTPERIYLLRDPMPLVCRRQESKDYDFIFVGNMVPEKSPSALIEVFNALAKKGLSFKAAVIGRGPLADQINEQIHSYNIGDRVEFLGYVDDVYEYLNRSRCFIMTSQTEGMPTVLLEAFQCGLPVIAPDVGDISDVVHHGKNGFLIPVDDINAYSAACEQIITDQEAYRRLADGVEEFCLKNNENYKLESIAQLWQDILQPAKLS